MDLRGDAPAAGFAGLDPVGPAGGAGPVAACVARMGTNGRHSLGLLIKKHSNDIYNGSQRGGAAGAIVPAMPVGRDRGRPAPR